MYLRLMTETQRDSVEIKRHANLAAKDFVKKTKFLIPQPPHSFGFEMLSQATQGLTVSCFEPDQRKVLHNLSIEAKIPLGTQARLAQ